MMIRSLAAEFAKLKRSRVIWWTLLAILGYSALDFAIGPYIISEQGAASLSKAGGVFAQAVEAGLYEPTWSNYLVMTPQMIAGGLALLLFAFVTAFLFGREFKERTAVQAFTVPVRREYLVLSKMVVLGVWMLALAVLALAIHTVDLALLGFQGFEWAPVAETLRDTALVTFMLYLTMPLFAWLAAWGRGYLRPMLGAIAILGIGNTLVVTDLSPYFPWNMPLHVVGASWMPIPPSTLVPGSWAVLSVVFVAGLTGTILYVDHADIPG